MPKDLPLVVPIIVPNIDWNTYIGTIYKLLKRSPNRRLDETNRSVGDYSSFLASLVEFSDQTDLPREIHSDHLSFTFLIQTNKDEYVEILRESGLYALDNLEVNDRELLVILSGTVTQWRKACFVFCSDDYSFRVRYIFDAIVLYLEKFKVFKGLSKRFGSDETFILEQS